jgi:hypothetical protein
MKSFCHLSVIILIGSMFFFSCKKQEYFKSESSIKKALKGTWDLIPIPRNDTNYNASHTAYTLSLHVENWTFDDSNVSIVQNNISGTSTYSVNTTISKAEFKVDGVSLPLSPDRYNGTWQIVQLDDQFLIIANDQNGSSGLVELEFQKR